MQRIKVTSGLLMLAAVLSLNEATAASAPALENKNGMVVTSQDIASRIGVDILKRGGNAVDAAIAVGYAQAVVNPCCGNIGGGGFMTIHMADGKDAFINFRETAPAAARTNMYLNEQGEIATGRSLYGWSAAGVPGTVMGLETARKKFGTLPRQVLMAPAIRLAKEGFILTRADTDIMDRSVPRFRMDPETSHIFLRKDGSPYQPGDRLIQTDLARTLSEISDYGADAFYRGRIPQAVESAAKKGGGIITAADFSDYHVTEPAPVICTYRGYRFISAPPPSSGGVALCEMLNIIEGYDIKKMGFNSAATLHILTESMRYAYMERNSYLGDPAFIKNPLGQMLSKEHAAEIRKLIKEDEATPSEKIRPDTGNFEKPETTHYSIADNSGNAVSTTYTINGFFGAIVIAPGTGFFLNDEMDDFTAKAGEKNMYGLVQGTANSIAPGKRPLSSMSPTVVTKDNRLFMVLGSPGGSRIPTITLQTAINVIDFGMEPQEAINAPRIHHQWLPDKIYYEQRGLSADTLNRLHQMGYKTQEQTPWGAAEVVLYRLRKFETDSAQTSGNDSSLSGKIREGYIYGANDVRRPAGSARGY